MLNNINLKPKNLYIGKKSSGGRNNKGRITVWHRGGGHKRLYRIINFKRRNENFEEKIIDFQYDPNRTAEIALILNEKDIRQTYSYSLRVKSTIIGDSIFSIPQENKNIKEGSCASLIKIPVGANVHAIENTPNTTLSHVRAAGTAGQITQKTNTHVFIKIPSGKILKFNTNCRAILGEVAENKIKVKKLYKAGQKRWLGKRPTVRGVAINPVDHPHGGGEGKTSGGRISVTPWGKYTKGLKTRKSKK